MKPLPLLLPLSWIYGVGVWVRNWLFERGFFRERHVSIPVVSVGNLSVGGTGKTPFVEYLAGMLRDSGKRVAVLSRGYRRASKGFLVVSNGMQKCAEAIAAGDEPAQMARNLEGVIVAVDEDRVRGAKNLIEAFHPDVLLLDDGFQHRWLGRSLDVVIIPASGLMTPVRLLPAGSWREPISSLDRADLLVISECETREDYARAVERVREFGKPVIGIRKIMKGVVRVVSDELVRPDEVKGRYAAFSGIGNPAGFERSLRQCLGSPLALEVFEDHYWYSKSDLHRLERVAKNAGATYLVTTQKDAVRLDGVKGLAELDSRIPIVALIVSVEVIDGEEHLKEQLEEL
ncbi:MAG: tetraacyldisaccharide 4'-kinase [Bacteroidota bacterium]